MIEVKDLSKIYGSTVAIQNIDFRVNAGEIVGFLGPNGAGKTTTLRILSGYTPATTGTAMVAGVEVHKHPLEVRRRIGYLPENPPLYLEMTVEGFLYFVAKIKGLPGGDRTEAINLVLKTCQLVDQRKTIIRKLSKGYRQRVGIASAIVHNPPVIILDEPTQSLDPQQVTDLRNLLKSLAGKHTIIFSSHILPYVSMMCERVIILNHGKIVAINTPEELTAQISGNISYEIEVEGDLTSVLPLVKNLLGVRQVEVTSINDRYVLQISQTSTTELGAVIAEVLVQQGLKLYEMRRIQQGLEEIFLKLTSKAK